MALNQMPSMIGSQVGMGGMPPPMSPQGNEPPPGQQQEEQLQQEQVLRAYTKEKICPFIRLVEDRRRTIEEKWMLMLDCWKGVHRRQGFIGEWFNHYMPHARRLMEKFNTRCKQMLLPSPDFFEVYPAIDGESPLGALSESWKSYMLWLMTRRNKIRGVLGQLIRCICLYQRGISKTGLQIGEDGKIWPSVRAVDPFMFYIWPETESDLSRAQLLFEHTMMPLNEYQVYVERKLATPLMPGELFAPSWPWHYIVRLSNSGLSSPTDNTATGSQDSNIPDSLGMLSITEAWFRLGGTWVQTWILWNVKDGPRVVRINTGFPVNPYRGAFIRQLPGEQYTPSMAADLEPLNVILNDQMNMTLEGEATSLFPATAINPNAVSRADSLVFKPRAKWLVDPAGVKVIGSQANPSAGYSGIQMTTSFMEQYSGLGGPLSEGQPARGMPRAGFAVSSLIGLSMSDIREVAEAIEDDILTPVLADMAKLTMTLPQEQLLKIPGNEKLVAAQPMMIRDLHSADYIFRWVGTLQSQDLQQRSQRMIAASKVMSSLVEPMSQQGYVFDYVSFFKRLFRDSFGERGADTLVRQMTQEEMQQRQQMMAMAQAQQSGQKPPARKAEGAQSRGGSVPGTAEAAERQESRQMQDGNSMTELSGMS